MAGVSRNKPTEYSLQQLFNFLLDTTVSPPVLRIGLVAKDVDSGAYYGVEGQFNDNGQFVLLTSGATGNVNSLLQLESGDTLLLESDERYLLQSIA